METHAHTPENDAGYLAACRWGYDPESKRRVLLSTPDGKPLVNGKPLPARVIPPEVGGAP